MSFPLIWPAPEDRAIGQFVRWLGRQLDKSSEDKSSTSSYTSSSLYSPSPPRAPSRPTISFPDVYTNAKVVLVGDSGVGKLGVCPECGKIFSEADVTYRRDHGFAFIKCICDTEIPLFDDKPRLAALVPSDVEAMERAVDIQRDHESMATLRQGNVLVQEISKFQLHSAKKATQQIHIYISSTPRPEDEMLLNELEKQLSMVKRQPDVSLRQKRFISPGENWAQEISAYVNEAHLILFLLSPDFLASKQCYEEMEAATKRMKAEEVTVIPLLLRPTANWEITPLGKLEPLPANRKSISEHPDRESTMRDIAEHIQLVVEKIRQDLAGNLST